MVFTPAYSGKVSPFGNPRLQTIFGISSWLIAAKYVLLPLFYPRHPFFALKKICYYIVKINLLFRINVIYYIIVLNTLNLTCVSFVKKNTRSSVAGIFIINPKPITRLFSTFFYFFFVR